MRIKGTSEWYTAALERHDPNQPELLLSYRRSLAGKSEEEIDKLQEDLFSEGVNTVLKSSRHNHTGIPAGTPYLQVEDEASVARLEHLWGKLGIELDPHRYDAYLKPAPKGKLADKIGAKAVPAWNSFLAWDIIQVAARGEDPVSTCRINLDHFDEYEQEKLKVRLTELGILGSERKASSPSESVRSGDLTFRVFPDCVQRLDELFVDKPNAKMDWRNLANWDSKKKVMDAHGAKVPHLRFCNKEMSSAEKKHFEKSLTACGIPWAIEVEEEGDFVRVMGEIGVQKLHRMLSPWQFVAILKWIF